MEKPQSLIDFDRQCIGILLTALAVAFVIWVIFGLVHASAADVGQIPPDVSPKVREWFKDARSPRSGSIHCCELADGHIVPYTQDLEGNFWVTIGEVTVPVPEDAIVPPPYVLAEGVVWYRLENGVPWIRCFAPGGGV
jgi:hypothetical protein